MKPTSLFETLWIWIKYPPMKKLLIGSLILLCLSGIVLAQKAGKKPTPKPIAQKPAILDLPEGCKFLLDRNLPGWRLVAISPEIKNFHQKNKYPFEPNLIRGDWNGDGKLDYAALIGPRLKTDGGGGDPSSHLTIFVQTDAGWKYFEFEGGDALVVAKKGSKGFDHDTKQAFTYQTDAVTDMIWEKSATTYLWKDNKFIQIVTSD